VLSKGWEHRISDTQINCEECPSCHCHNWHFYMNHTSEKDGVWCCQKCGEDGNLYQLREMQGDRQRNVTSMRDVAQGQRPPEALPDIEACHRKLMREAEDPAVEEPAIEYLQTRGFTMEIIERYKLGLEEKYGKRWLVIPYFKGSNPIYAKFRSLPPHDKEFRGLSGREMPLFNADCLKKDMDEVILCEGEADTLACLSQGIECVVGVPGANGKKAVWIDLLDKLEPKNIYILYDSDKVGQEAAKEIAKRIGIDKVKNISLPEFKWVDEHGEERDGKDINDWFRAGNTLEDFQRLKEESRQFAVDGVFHAGEVVQNIKDRLVKGETLKARYITQWGTLNRFIGGFDDGDLVGVMAEGKVGKTTMAMNLLDFLTVEYRKPAMMFCQEMLPERMVQKWISCVTDQAEVTLESVDLAMNIALNREADYLFAYTRSLKWQEVHDTIRQAVRRYGVKFVCFDNLQMLCRSMEHSTQETSVITKAFKQLAMELGIVIFLIIQPHRVSEGQIIAARNAHGSSAIEKDVDCMICLHRNRQGRIGANDFAEAKFMEVEENFSPEMLVRADLTRYAPGGATTLWMDGAKSKVTEFTQAQIERANSLMPVDVTNHVHTAQFEAA
jgi:5S rRNA maturation endonuclease (ribonuclease M5)/KaiC/GvpD/RAD55 family RecA-like ATPase